MRTVRFIFVMGLNLCSLLIFLAINKSILYNIYHNDTAYALFDKLTIAKCNVTKSKVEQFLMASLQHFLVHPIDDKQCELNFAPILIDESLINILLELW